MSGGARSYQFVVIAVATVDNVEIPGERPANPVTPTSDGGMDYYEPSVVIVIPFDGVLLQESAVEML